MSSAPSGGDEERMKAASAQARAQDDARHQMLVQIVEPAALERLNRIRLVKPEKARAIGDSLIGAAQSGRLQSRVTEERLVAMLSDLEKQSAAEQKVEIARKKYGASDSESEDSDDW